MVGALTVGTIVDRLMVGDPHQNLCSVVHEESLVEHHDLPGAELLKAWLLERNSTCVRICAKCFHHHADHLMETMRIANRNAQK